MIIVETPDDAAYTFSHPAGGPTSIGPTWRPQLGRFGYLRSLRMAFSPRATTSISRSDTAGTRSSPGSSSPSGTRSPAIPVVAEPDRQTFPGPACCGTSRRRARIRTKETRRAAIASPLSPKTSSGCAN